MNPADEIPRALGPVVDALEALGATYVIGGSVASSALGVPRSTLDVDLVCDLGAANVDRFVAALEGDYYADAGMIRGAIERRACFVLLP